MVTMGFCEGMLHRLPLVKSVVWWEFVLLGMDDT